MTRANAVLGISTSGPVEAAILDGARAFVGATKEQALASLLGCVERVLRDAGMSLDGVGLIAVCVGPGSFTGLRIGVAFSKALAQARDIPLVGVSAYDVAQAGSVPTRAGVALVSGKRGFYYARVHAHKHAPFLFVRGDAAAMSEAIRVAAGAGDEPVTLYGEMPGSIKEPHVVGSSFAQRPPGDRAREVAKLGLQARKAGASGDWRTLEIDYGQAPYVP